MKQVSILVEGQTEETFVKEVLAKHLYSFNVSLVPTIVKTKKRKGGPHYRGGVVNYDHVKRDLRILLQSSVFDCVTTMLDLYALPTNFPKLGDINSQGVDKARELEQAFLEDIANERFLPYIQVHEFEALLFSDVKKFSYAFSDYIIKELSKIAGQFDSPEDINETADGAPSKRILQVVGDKNYQKPLHGPIIAMEISLETMREKCLHFNEWLSRLENI